MVKNMNAEEIIYKRFIRPFENKKAHHIGVEAEFPVVNTKKGDTDVSFVSSVSDYLEKEGFSCVLYGTGGEKLFMENDEGDCLSFDNSYNNFEFSLNHGENLCDLYKRFNRYFDLVQEYLLKKDHMLCGSGTNPNFKNLSVNHAPFKTYNMVQKYLHTFKSQHNYPDFPAFMSSVQTHLDVPLEKLPQAYTFFARTDFLRGILFHNSPDFENKGYRIFRDYLWEKSAFGACPGITGAVDEAFETTDDIIKFFLEKGMFNRLRGGEYEIFEPVKIKEYFENAAFGAMESDIECYLSFRNVEITARGTLEIRSDCTQPIGKTFAPPAFNTGLLYNMEKAENVLGGFFERNGITMKNSYLRGIVASGGNLTKIAPESEMKKLCGDMLCVSRAGLLSRGFGEEKLIENIII